MSTVLGVLGVIASFGLFWFAETYLRLPRPTIQTLIFLKLLVAGHFTIYLTRNTGWFWQKPYPNWKLIVAGESTKVFGTLAAVYGWLMPPIGWTYALAVWGYAIAWFFITNVFKLGVLRIEATGPNWHARSWSRMAARIWEHSGNRGHSG
jgi:H+-transporting ATPase